MVVVLVACLGLAERHYATCLPYWLYKGAGDALWALCVYLFAACLCPAAPGPLLALTSLSFACLIECSQLYHAAWIDAVRSYRLGALVLGSGFQ